MTRPGDAVRCAVRTALQNEGADPGALALVACSGGPDSLTLAAAAAQAAHSARWRVGAVVVDHGLQPGSEQVAVEAARRCRDLGLDPVEIRPVVVGDAPSGPESRARTARYRALALAANDCGAAAVLVAHSLDDQAETVLLGLARGSGARSLAGMAVRSQLQGTTAALLRPLLGLRRATLLAACRDWGLQPWLDPHNDDPAFTRVRVRHDLLPAAAAALGPGVPEALARTAASLRDDEEVLSAIAADVARQLEQGSDPRQGIVCADLAVHPAAIRRRVLQRMAIAAGCPAADITALHLHRLDRMVVGAGRFGPLALPGCVTARRRYGRLGFARGLE